MKQSSPGPSSRPSLGDRRNKVEVEAKGPIIPPFLIPFPHYPFFTHAAQGYPTLTQSRKRTMSDYIKEFPVIKNQLCLGHDGDDCEEMLTK